MTKPDHLDRMHKNLKIEETEETGSDAIQVYLHVQEVHCGWTPLTNDRIQVGD